jgi:hypothetical protein
MSRSFQVAASDALAQTTRVRILPESSKELSTLTRTLLEMKFLVTEIFRSGDDQRGAQHLSVGTEDRDKVRIFLVFLFSAGQA